MIYSIQHGFEYIFYILKFIFVDGNQNIIKLLSLSILQIYKHLNNFFQNVVSLTYFIYEKNLYTLL